MEEGKEGKQYLRVTLGLWLHSSLSTSTKMGASNSRVWKCFASCKVLSSNGWSKRLGNSVGSLKGDWHTLSSGHGFKPLPRSLPPRTWLSIQ